MDIAIQQNATTALTLIDTSEDAEIRQQEDAVIAQAKGILDKRLLRYQPILTKPKTIKDYLLLELAERESEAFYCLFLDNKHRLITMRLLFNGTIDACSVYPREVVKEALIFNAAAIIFAHNHPSGSAEISQADIRITKNLQDALGLLDIRVLDHFIVAGTTVISFAEQGMI